MAARFLRQDGEIIAYETWLNPNAFNNLFTEHPMYFITMCTYNRRRILASSSVHESFVDLESPDKRDIR